jgi:hypothetical protein
MMAIMLPMIHTRFETLEAQRASLLSRFSGIEPALWISRPAQARKSLSASLSTLVLRHIFAVSLPEQDTWTLSEIAHHLVLAEREVLRQLHSQTNSRNMRSSLRDRLGAALVGTAFRYGFRVRTPALSVVPRAGLSYEEIRADWDEARSELAAYLTEVTEASRDLLVFRHPVAGSMNIEQTLDLLGHHITHHLRQVARTERALGIERRA